jgi:predicted nucleic acid-binding protein
LTVRVVADASALVAVLIDNGPAGTWAVEALEGADLSAPHVMPFEAANILRRHEAAGLITADHAAQAHLDLVELNVELWPHEILADRAWTLRHNLSIYDASYVALAEALEVGLVTLDRRIKDAPGVHCPVQCPVR